MPQNDATSVIPFGGTRDDPVFVTVGFRVGRQASNCCPSVSLFDKVLFLAIPEIEFCFFIDESWVRVER